MEIHFVAVDMDEKCPTMETPFHGGFEQKNCPATDGKRRFTEVCDDVQPLKRQCTKEDIRDYTIGRLRGDLSEFSNKLRVMEEDLHPFQSQSRKDIEKCNGQIKEVEMQLSGITRTFDGNVTRAAMRHLNDYLAYNSDNFNDWDDFVEETDKVVDQFDTMKRYVYSAVPRIENKANDMADAHTELWKENSRLRKRIGTLTERLDEMTKRFDTVDQTVAHWMLTIRQTGCIPRQGGTAAPEEPKSSCEELML